MTCLKKGKKDRKGKKECGKDNQKSKKCNCREDNTINYPNDGQYPYVQYTPTPPHGLGASQCPCYAGFFSGQALASYCSSNAGCCGGSCLECCGGDEGCAVGCSYN